MNAKELTEQETNPSSNRPLIAYAFLAQTAQTAGDLLSGLAPIFKPIAKSLAGQPFDPKEFALRARELYGIDIHPWAVEDLAPRLEKAQLLSRDKISEKLFEYRYSEIDAEFNSITETDIRAVISSFVDFVTPILDRHQLKVATSDLEAAFLDQLVSMNFQSILLKPDAKLPDDVSSARQTLGLPQKPEKIAWLQQISMKARLDVLCASYILHLHTANNELYDLLVRISTGALIAETVLNFQNPEGASQLTGLNVVLDAPFVMAVLDLSEEESTDYARRICDQMRLNGASIYVFRHSIEEISSNLKAAISASEHGEGYGATVRRMSKQSFNSYVRSVVQNVEGTIRRQGYQIIEMPSGANLFQHFSEGDEGTLLSSIGYYENPIAQKRDAASVAAIMRLRRGKTTSMAQFQRAGYIFVTANDRLARKSDRCTVTLKQRERHDVPPVLTDKYLAGLLFVLYGGAATELTQCRLLANCSAALEPRSDVMRRMHGFLAELDKTKADHFRALMTNERASQHMMQVTLGDAALIRSGAGAAAVLEQMEATLAEKYKQEASEQLNKLAKEFDVQQQTQREMLTQKSLALTQVMTENLTLANELGNTQRRLQCLEEERIAKETEERERIRLAILECATDAQRVMVKKRQMITTAVAACAAVLAFASIKWVASSDAWLPYFFALLTGVLTWLGFWKTPELIFGELLGRVRGNEFARLVFDRQLSTESANYVVCWNPPSVQRKISVDE